jgi:hypothetical protein
MSTCNYRNIVTACERDLATFGDTYQGVGWTKKKGYADLRYQVMLEGIRPEWGIPIELLDFGCGASHLYEYILDHGYTSIGYSGLDLSPRFLEVSRRKHPHVPYLEVDLLDPDASIPRFDYIVMNGLFNYKGDLDQEEMWTYCLRLLQRAFAFARRGLAFNVMSKYVDWERSDLFHVPLDPLCEFIASRMSRHFTVRHDYGLYEYTVYVYTSPLSDHA